MMSMYILYCDIFWLKLIDRIFLIRFLAVSLFVRYKKKLVTNNKKLVNSYICHSGCPNYQITTVVFSHVGWGGGEVVCVDST
jgi:hypothetical protein